MSVYCVHPFAFSMLVRVCVCTWVCVLVCCEKSKFWMKPYTASLRFVLKLANTKGIHYRTSGQPLMSPSFEVQTPGESQTIFTFPSAEIRGLYAGFYLINKTSKAKHFSSLCVLRSCGDHRGKPSHDTFWIDVHEHVHWQTRLDFTQFEPQHWCKHGLAFPSNFLRKHYFGLYQKSFRSPL